MRVKGDWGEARARRYLEAAGFTIVANNFCVHGGEIDIIARAPDGVLVFFEIKVRVREPVDHRAVLPYKKLVRMRRAAAQFLLQCGATRIRFDLILLVPVVDEKKVRVFWYRDVGR